MTGSEQAIALGAGIFTGLISSMLGVGGGLIVIPFMLIVLDSGQHVAEGTSLLVIIPTAIAGAVIHARNDLVDWTLLKTLIIGGLVGVVLGGLIAVNADGEVLKTIYTAFIFFISYRFLRARKVDSK